MVVLPSLIIGYEHLFYCILMIGALFCTYNDHRHTHTHTHTNVFKNSGGHLLLTEMKKWGLDLF